MPHRVYVTARWLDLPRTGSSKRSVEGLLDATVSLAAFEPVLRFAVAHARSPEARVRQLGADGAVPLYEATSAAAALEVERELVGAFDGHRKLVVSEHVGPEGSPADPPTVYFFFWVR